MSAESAAPDAAEKLDGAKERLRAAAEKPATPQRAARTPASYHVFRLEEDEVAGEDCPFWRWLTPEKPVSVESLGRDETKKQEAIKAASGRLTPEELNGTFVAVKEGEWLPMPREQRLEDIFG
jgi:hypothetical protein